MIELMDLMGKNPDIPKHVRERHDIKKVAQQFESVLVNQLMQSMRKTVGESFLHSMGKDTFTSMLDQEYSKAASETGTFGLAAILEEQLGANIAETVGERYLRQNRFMSPVTGRVGKLRDGQKFGSERPLHAEHGHGARDHQGLDLARATGTSVRAASKGVINRIERSLDSAAGRWVGISHGEGALNTRYMHLDSISKDLKMGDEVRIGQEIGKVGNTGTASRGSHLHFEIFEKGSDGQKSHINPEPYVRMWEDGMAQSAHAHEKEEDLPQVSEESDDSDDVRESGLRPEVLGKFRQSRYQLGSTSGGKP